jgi:hypothetical protein
MTKKQTLSFGERVKLSLFCPIDSEGIGPIPGDQGYIVSHPASTDARRAWIVYFDHIGSEWQIPEQFLETPRITATMFGSE